MLGELGLVEFDQSAVSCRVLDAPRTELERSPSYRAAAERLARSESALAAELPGSQAIRAA